MLRLGSVVNRYATAVVRRRYPAPTVVDGYATPGTPVESPARAVVLPASGRDLERVREGLRDKVRFIAWTTADLRTVDQAEGLPPDELVFAGVSYLVAGLRDYRQHGEFRELALLAKVT